MVTVARAFELFEEAATCDDAERCVGIYESVLELQRGRGDLAQDGVTITVAATLRNLAGMMQELRQFARMRELTIELCTLDPADAQHHMLHSIALKHTGQVDAALVAVKQAVALEPSAPQPHHELACQLLAAGEIDGALASVEQAMAHGSHPDVLNADGELARLHRDPRWAGVVNLERYVVELLGVVSSVHFMIAATLPDPTGDDALDDQHGAAWLADPMVVQLLGQAMNAFERLFAVGGPHEAKVVAAAQASHAFWLVGELAGLFQAHGVCQRDM